MDNIDISSNPLKDWNSNPEWKSMDATVKGFFSQLLLIAAFNKPAGYLPDDDKLWRKWLNIPQKTFDDDDYENYSIDQKEVAKTIKKYFDSTKNTGISSAMLEALESIWEEDISHKHMKNARISYDSWMNYLWIYQWKPSLEKALLKIDVKLKIQFEDLNGLEGFFFPLAYSMSNQEKKITTISSDKNTEIKTTKSRKKKKNNTLPLPDIFESQALDFSDIGYDGILWVDSDNSSFSNLAKVLRLWRTPISSNKRKSIWDIGVSCLEDSPSNYPKARRFLGKMIKEHSEDKVARTVAEIARRPTMALEPYALFRTIITSYEQGTVGEQKARAQRAQVAL